MRRQLPSMISLSCFETVARLLSVTQAAEELHLTQSAVSRQVKKLEEELGCDLFVRERQRLQLTESGRKYAQEVAPLLNQLEAATRQINGNIAGQLRIGAEPSFTTRWLLPRLGEFKQQHPELEVEIMNDLHRLYGHLEGFDVAIMYGDGNWPDMESHYLMQGELVAVCTPELHQHYGAIKDPKDLLNYPILHHIIYSASPQLSSTYLWLKQAGLSDDEITALPGQRFEHFQFVLDAALHGLGVTVLPEYFVQPELDSGQLVTASENKMCCGAYYVTVRQQQTRNPTVRLFMDWLQQVVEQPVTS